jgi:uncharacterized protein (DUF2225 family)
MLFILSNFLSHSLNNQQEKESTYKERQGKVRKKRQKERVGQSKGNHLKKGITQNWIIR